MWTFNNNLIIGVQKRPEFDTDTGLVDPIAGYYHWEEYDPVNDQIQVYNNVLQGSDLIGFVFPDTPCQLKQFLAF
jgi:hypothetical protein